MKILEIIRKTDKGYVLYSKSKTKSGKRKKLGGPYKSRTGAEDREQEVQYFKHANEAVVDNQYIGNCTQEDVIDDLFGSVTDFAWLVDEYGDEFTHNGITVTYDEDSDIHSFYYTPEIT